MVYSIGRIKSLFFQRNGGLFARKKHETEHGKKEECRMDQKAVNGKGTAWGKKRDGIADETLDNHGCFGVGKEEKDESTVEAVFCLEKNTVRSKCFFGFRHSTDRGLLYLIGNNYDVGSRN
jgi:hypothetical protein